MRKLWASYPYWIKGGIIGFAIGFAIAMYAFIFPYLLVIIEKLFGNDFSSLLNKTIGSRSYFIIGLLAVPTSLIFIIGQQGPTSASLGYAVFVSILILPFNLFIIGAIIGAIVGLIKKSENKK